MRVSPVMLSVCLNYVKWHGLILGGTFTFYVNFQVRQVETACIKPGLHQICRLKHCSVIVHSGQMSHLSILNTVFLHHRQDFYHNSVLHHTLLRELSCPYALSAVQHFMKWRYCAVQERDQLCVFALNTEVPCGSVLCLLCKYWQMVLWGWMIYSLRVYESSGFLSINRVSRKSRYK